MTDWAADELARSDLVKSVDWVMLRKSSQVLT